MKPSHEVTLTKVNKHNPTAISQNLMVLSREPDTRNGPTLLLFRLPASATAGMAESGAQQMHSTTCSCSRSSTLHSLELINHTRTVYKNMIIRIEQDFRIIISSQIFMRAGYI
uniref:Uncharacterized protein n=1 Tax=Romanomermis culicivorax TaxID=13658 RepID=A0A915ICW9_ROMCU